MDPGLFDDLVARGLVADTTDRVALRARLGSGPIALYCGFDPTADSLHVGNLIGLVTLRRFQLAGHRPIALAGGATGMIGDPSGRSEERNLLDDERLARNLEGIVPQLRQFLDFETGPAQARLVDNRSWTVAMSAIDFLRDVGKFVTVNQMLGKESVRARIAGTAGISYTEFSYMLLQANDFAELYALEGCELQVGGSDQWGNISLGVELVRKRHGAAVHGLTWPLLTRADGTKYGKSSSGEQLWLGAHRLSPYRFYQGWMHVEDADVRRLLLQLTLLPVAEVDDVVEAHLADPGRRIGQRRVAGEVTALVHGATVASTAAAASEVLFGGDVAQVDPETLSMLAGEVPTAVVDRAALDRGVDPVVLFVEAGAAASKGEARRLLDQRGWSVNGRRLEPGDALGRSDLLHGRWILVRRGRSAYTLLEAR
ncbi:MAG: tyrosine--tRNA ligase [Actinobacteria bacterium]|nr:tyrosine--tRNA ligase [Actinomycetota bacterium]